MADASLIFPHLRSLVCRENVYRDSFSTAAGYCRLHSFTCYMTYARRTHFGVCRPACPVLPRDFLWYVTWMLTVPRVCPSQTLPVSQYIFVLVWGKGMELVEVLVWEKGCVWGKGMGEHKQTQHRCHRSMVVYSFLVSGVIRFRRFLREQVTRLNFVKCFSGAVSVLWVPVVVETSLVQR